MIFMHPEDISFFYLIKIKDEYRKDMLLCYFNSVEGYEITSCRLPGVMAGRLISLIPRGTPDFSSPGKAPCWFGRVPFIVKKICKVKPSKNNILTSLHTKIVNPYITCRKECLTVKLKFYIEIEYKLLMAIFYITVIIYCLRMFL